MVELNTFRNNLKENKLNHVYLLVVQEEYEYRKLLEEIKKEYLSGVNTDFDFDRLDGKETDLTGIVHIANTCPMMSDKRLVIVNNAESIPDTGKETFKDFVETPNDTCLLLLIAKEELQSKSWASLLHKKNLVLEFKKQDEKNLPGWVISYVRKQGYSIDVQAAKALVDQVGDSLYDLVHQLDKTLILLKKGETIDVNTVEELILRSRRHKYWELSDAAGEKKLAAALLIINHMLDDGEPEIVLLSIISNYFRRILNARMLLDAGVKSEEVCNILGQKWYQKKFINQVNMFDRGRLEQIFSFIRQADENIKVGYLSPKDNLERVIYNICSDNYSFPKPLQPA